ncbi:hypothetical protein GHS02_17210 [Salmonella enterica subsp. enterica serovar Chester]|nr:hypothetical protein [Salmonella enterica subsp. enterica serovar Chester]
MKEVKIYTIVSDQLSPPITGESFCTDMVRHSDYAELEAKYAALAEDNDKAMESLKQADAVVKLAHKKFSAMAAENTALKKSEVEFNEYCRRECEDVGDTWVDEVKQEFPDANYYTASGGFNLLLGDSEAGSLMVALSASHYLSIGDGDF